MSSFYTGATAHSSHTVLTLLPQEGYWHCYFSIVTGQSEGPVKQLSAICFLDFQKSGVVSVQSYSHVNKIVQEISQSNVVFSCGLVAPCSTHQYTKNVCKMQPTPFFYPWCVFCMLPLNHQGGQLWCGNRNFLF